MKNLSLALFFSLLLSSCSYFLTDHKNDYLKEKQEKSLDLPENITTRPIIDYYPINTLNPEEVGNEYVIPMPDKSGSAIIVKQ